MKIFFSFFMCAALGSLCLTSCDNSASSGASQKIVYNGTSYNVTGRYFDESAEDTFIRLYFGQNDITLSLRLDNSLLGQTVQLASGATSWELGLASGQDSYIISNTDLAGFTGWFKVVKNGNANYSVSFELARTSGGDVSAEGSVDGAFTYDPRATQQVDFNGTAYDVTSKNYGLISGNTVIYLVFGNSDVVMEFNIDDSLLGFRVPLNAGATPWSVGISAGEDYIITNGDPAGFTGWFRIIRNDEGNYTVSFEIGTINGDTNFTGSVEGEFTLGLG